MTRRHRSHTRARLAALPLAIAAGGCQDYIFEQQCPASVTEAEANFSVVEPVPVDIVFVIDNSGSMRDEQENLARNFDRFIDVIAGSSLNYRLAVVTTDLGDQLDQPTAGPEWAGFVDPVVDQSNPTRVVDFSDRSGCRRLDTVQHGCFRPASGNRWLDSERDSARAIVDAFAGEASQVGTCGSGAERGTEAMLAALENTQPGRCNEGFLRDEANLVVVFVTDEDDFGADAPSNIIARIGQYKPIEQVRVALIGAVVDNAPSSCRAGPDGGAISTCGSLCDQGRPAAIDMGPCPREGCPTYFTCTSYMGNARCVNQAFVNWDPAPSGFGCDSCSAYAVADCCAADVGASSYVDFALALEREVAAQNPEVDETQCLGGEGRRPACLIDSICQTEFAKTLERIARDLVVVTTFPLDPPASYPPGVVVRLVGGRYADAPRELTQGEDFTVSSDGTEIELRSADLLPRDDEELEILFVVENEIEAEPRGACVE